MKKKILLICLIVLTCFLAGFYAFAWSPPTASPPGANVPPPINVGSTAQTKTGNLTLSNLYLNATVNEGSVYRVNAIIGYNDLFLKSNSAENAPVYIAGSRLSFYSGGSEKWRIDSTGSLTMGSVPWARLTSFPSDCPSGQYVYGIGGTLKCSTPPTNGNGGGDITAVNAGSGLTGGGTSGSVTLNVGAGTGISVGTDTVGLRYASKSCGSGYAIQSFNLGSRNVPTCVEVGDGGISCPDCDSRFLNRNKDDTTSYKLTVNGGIGAGGRNAASGYGILAQGSTMGGHFEDTDSGIWTFAAYGSYGIYTLGRITAVGDIRTSDNLLFDGELMPDGATCATGQIVKKAGSNNWDCVDMPGGISSCSDCDSRFVNVSGDTMTGNLTVIGNLTVSNKITAKVFDPIYNIEGKSYSTYGHSTIGLKEEVMGKVELGLTLEGGSYSYVIDFDEQGEGSDLWLFREITAFGENWEDLVVILTPEGKAQVWYEFVPGENLFVIYGDESVKVSYRLVASRFDWSERDTNLASKEDQGTGLKVK